MSTHNMRSLAVACTSLVRGDKTHSMLRNEMRTPCSSKGSKESQLKTCTAHVHPTGCSLSQS
eukprot:3361080-Amphidinium_carterae.1